MRIRPHGVSCVGHTITFFERSHAWAHRLNNTRTFGLVYFPWLRLGAYADYSEGFTIQSNANPKMDGTFAGANIVPSKAESAGVRFRLASTESLTIVGSAGYYQAEQGNSAISINVGAVNTLWSNHRMPERYIETFSSSPMVTAANNSIQSTRSYAGKGWEGNLTVNIANSLRLVLNAAWPQTRQFDTAAEKIAAAMQAALSDVTLKTKGEVTLTDNVLKLEGLPKASATPTPTKAQLGSDAAPASKAAVNKVMQGLACDLRQFGIIVCPVHPGWVRTDMGGSSADISVEESASGLIALLDRLTLKDSGRFYQWNGTVHPW